MSFRSLLFVPATRLELLAKVPRWRPDAVVVDLEDAVAEAQKDDARRAMAEAELGAAGSAVFVRVNASGTPWHDLDVAACAQSAAAGVVLPKAEDPGVVRAVSDRLNGEAGREVGVLLGIESALGLARARELLATGAVAAYFGAEDYLADIGGRHSVTGLEVLYARSEVVVAGRLAGVAVIDQAVVAVEDDAAFTADAEQGRDLGYAGKICVHPRQVALAHATFTPGEAEVAAARRVLDAAASGVAVVDGRMVDAVHTRLARQVISAAGAGAGGDTGGTPGGSGGTPGGPGETSGGAR
jgi:citrate lyase subunit beta/citryl-CoA lyase